MKDCKYRENNRFAGTASWRFFSRFQTDFDLTKNDSECQVETFLAGFLRVCVNSTGANPQVELPSVFCFPTRRFSISILVAAGRGRHDDVDP